MGKGDCIPAHGGCPENAAKGLKVTMRPLRAALGPPNTKPWEGRPHRARGTRGEQGQSPGLSRADRSPHLSLLFLM